MTTDSARAVIVVDAILKDHQLEKSRQQIMQNLSGLVSNVKWVIIKLNRGQDQSGLAKLHLLAQARVPNSQVNRLQQEVKKLSKPGQQYKIAQMDFTPNLAEQQNVLGSLRAKIYQQVKQELKRLNQTFPGQHYFMHSIRFSGVPHYRTTILAKVPQAMDKASPPVGRQAMLSAQVVLSSIAKQGK